jgi:NitT/TauT family transport system substrate-binding protein
VEVPFEEMAEKLAVGQIDAAFMTEPFLSEAAKSIGAVPLLDTAVGPTMNLATAGFGINASFARTYPKTTAAFQEVMRRATLDANSDRSTVEPMLVQHASVDETTARLPSLLTFKSALEPDQIQRVADLMRDFKMIPSSIDVSRMMALTLVPR